MKAGRELDALIAEKVMGKLLLYKLHEMETMARKTKAGAERVDRMVPRYSTQIADAWLVVEKLVEMGCYVDIGVDEHGGQVQLDSFGGEDDRWVLGESTRAATAPLAICLAALKAVE